MPLSWRSPSKKAGDENQGRAVSGKAGFDARKTALLHFEPLEERVSAPAADGVPYGISQHCGREGKGEDPNYVELAPGGIDGSSHEKGLTGRGNAEAFDEYDEKYGGIAVSDEEDPGLCDAAFQVATIL